MKHFLKDLVFAEDIKLLDRNSSSMYYLYSNLFSSLDRKKNNLTATDALYFRIFS